MSKLSVRVIFVGCLLASPVGAQSEYVLLVEAAECASAPASRSQTGFVTEGLNGIVTALHGVAGCKHLTVRHSDGSMRPILGLRVQMVDIERDAALLGKDGLDLQASGLQVSPLSPNSLEDAYVLGHPSSMGGIHRMDLEIGSPPLRHLGDLVPSGLFQKLQGRGSPSVTVNVISVNDDLQPGHSGAPLLDTQGRVLGIANGGLAGGTLGIGWAIPFAELRWETADYRELGELGRKSPDLVFSIGPSDRPPPAPRPTVRRQPSVEQVVDLMGFRFSLRGCFRDGPSLRCEVLVTNREQDRDLDVRGGRLIDEVGNEQGAVLVGFGPETGYLSGRSRLVSGVPVRAQIKFENIGRDVTRLSLLELELGPPGRAESRRLGVFGVPRVQFRSVAIREP